MPLETWIVYVAAVLVLMSTPGPSQLLMLSNSVANGFRRSLATACGDLTANLGQMLAAGLGLAALLLAFDNALTIIKWAGVAYLIWLGVRMLRRSGRTVSTAGVGTSRVTLKALWLQGFLTSTANPKAVVFFAALFPQFIAAQGSFWLQFWLLAATYLVIDGMFLSAYGITAGWLANRLNGPAKAWLDRIGGSFLILAAVLLGLKSLRDA